MYTTTQFAAAAAIVVAGACTTAMNWRFSYQLGTTIWDSYTWAIFSVALDVAKWLMLPCAARAWGHNKLRALAAGIIWSMATVYSFTAAIGFAALNRDATASERHRQAQLQGKLDTMRQSPRWTSSAGCADATTPQSRQFCAAYRATEAQLSNATQDADPQSMLFARLSGFSVETVRLTLALFLALACEAISALGFFAIMGSWRQNHTHPQDPAPPWKPPAWNDLAGRDVTRHVGSRRDMHGMARREMEKPPVATPGAAPLQEVSLLSSQERREAIQASISEQYHATLQAPRCNRLGNFPAFSRRAICCEQ